VHGSGAERTFRRVRFGVAIGAAQASEHEAVTKRHTLDWRTSFRHNLLMTFARITIDPAVCTGKPCIRGLRFPVARLLGLLAAGETREQILTAFPYLEPGDIDEALRYAAFLAEDETVELTPTN
jgi:uncharacterized protein (DUF433 family)